MVRSAKTPAICAATAVAPKQPSRGLRILPNALKIYSRVAVHWTGGRRGEGR